MTIRLQFFLIILITISLVYIINMIRKEYLELKYVLTWLLLQVGILSMVLYPKVIDSIAILIGVETPINALVFMGYLFQLIIIFSITIAVSRNSDRIKVLIQEIAILNNTIEKMSKK